MVPAQHEKVHLRNALELLLLLHVGVGLYATG
jgi:hypothetical protein